MFSLAGSYLERLLGLRNRGVKSEGEKNEKTVVCLLGIGTWAVYCLDRIGAGADNFGNRAGRRPRRKRGKRRGREGGGKEPRHEFHTKRYDKRGWTFCVLEPCSR